MKALLKKNPHQVDGNDADKSMNGSGEIEDLYQFLEKSGSHYVSLLARVVPEAYEPSFSDSPSIADSPDQPTQIDSPPKTVLFNETRLGHTKDQEDIVIAADEEQDMLCVVSDYRRLLPISNSQEMMVGIAYVMPYEVRQFQLFNVCLHIDLTADSNKEGRPLMTEEEYFLSKALFMKFVASRQVREVLGLGVGEAIIKFARESVIPHEERMAYYKRHGLFHLETYMDCGHEGTNNGMKHCAFVPRP
jgi:hypothetical protein